ncbi:MAG: RdgB/HAM1 family non-canonical purine NTP pyrophosphatase [Gammaproteobacteria bacterium]|nr:RdgB/HAM1 family non-canonical purine NTP pyrophosphatase [Gammaproteobacteria bacterium]
MSQQTLVIASHNRGKLVEIADLLEQESLNLISAADAGIGDVEETGRTFVENALLKARNACQQTGHAALGDDSGLEVDYLNGAPGIFSSRFAGPDATDSSNLEKLLTALQGVPHAQRSARFRCCIVVLRHVDDPAPLICEGSWEGHIAEKAKGDNGFGYDPVFLPGDAIGTAAQLSAAQKQTLSHRATALLQLKAQLHRFLCHVRHA